MFCTNCGKEMNPNGKFCLHCGHKLDDDTAIPQNVPVQNNAPVTFWGNLCQFSIDYIVSVLTTVATIINAVIVFVHNEIYTQYELLYQEDWIVLSEQGKELIYTVTGIYALVSILMMFFMSRQQSPKTSTVIKMVIFSAIFIILTSFKVPAPY